MITLKQLTRNLIFICIVLYTGFAGLVELEEFIILGFPIFDFSILIVIFYSFYSYKTFKYWGDKGVLYPIKIMILLTTIVIFSMPFRGDETLLQGFQTGRRFYILLLALVVIDNIRVEGNLHYVQKVLLFFGYYYSILVMINYLFPGSTTTIWKGIGSLSGFKGSVERHVLKANDGLLLIHLSFLVEVFRIISDKTKRKLKEYVSCFFLSLAVFCMGYRAVMMTTFLSIPIIMYFCWSSLKRYKLFDSSRIIGWAFLLIVGIVIVDNLMGNAISGTIAFANGEIAGDNEGTLAGRLNRSLVYQIPMLLLSPYFGYGFVSVHSKMAQDLGYIRLEEYSRSLYYFDFGYITLFVMFGLIGGIIIIYSLIKGIKRNLRLFGQKPSEYFLACAGFIIALLLCNYSFGALEYGIGQLPLSIIVGCAAGQSLLNRKEKRLMR